MPPDILENSVQPIVLEALTQEQQKKHSAFKNRPGSPLEFRQLEIERQSLWQKFTIKLLPRVNSWIEFEIIDGRRRKFFVEIYDSLMSKYQCSCHFFIEDESNTCVHVAVIKALRSRCALDRENKEKQVFAREFYQMVLKLPLFLNKYKQRFIFYNPQIKKFGQFGSIGECVDSCTVKTYRKILAEKEKEQKKEEERPEPNDENILKEVSLYDYQKDIFGKMFKAKRAICSMTMGAGKTITSLACYGFTRKISTDKEPSLVIICPKSLKIQWQGEIKRVLGLESFQVSATKDLENIMTKNIIITTYQFFNRHSKEFSKRSYDMSIVDEIQFIRNGDSKTWKSISKLKSEYFFGLSGTVIENRLDDLYSIMEIIKPNCLGPKWKFDEEFQNLIALTKGKILYKGVKNVDKLRGQLKDNVFSYNDLKLPNITHDFIKVSLNKEEKANHDEYFEKARELIAKSLEGIAKPWEKLLIQAYLLKARQSCNSVELITKDKNTKPSSKIEKFIELIDDICVKKNEKVVVFSDWVEMLEIADRYTKDKVESVFYTGSKTQKQRQEAVLRFQKDDKIKIFYASDAAAQGLDGLQLICNNIIQLELGWNPAKNDQKIGRLHRILQTKDVYSYYIMSNGAIEENIYNLLNEKREIRHSALKDLNVSKKNKL